MSVANVYEQYTLELVNRERAKVGAQPLAFNGYINTAAELHSSWMLENDIFSHTGVNGTRAGDRMKSAGYVFSGSWTWGENVAWLSLRGAAGYQDELDQIHTNLMNSDGHRTNLLNGAYREAGIGFEVGQFIATSGTWDAAMVTQNFAKSGTAVFLTGVAFDDLDGDRLYDIGEGLGSANVSITNSVTGAVTSITTSAAGGYSLAWLPARTV
jgi:hypothetical protein